MVRIYGITTPPKSGVTGVETQYKVYGTSNGSGFTFLSKNGVSTETLSNSIVLTPSKSSYITYKIIASPTLVPQECASWNLMLTVAKDTTPNSINIIDVSPVNATSHTNLSGLSIELSENKTLGSISIKCTGVSGYNGIDWVASIYITEV